MSRKRVITPEMDERIIRTVKHNPENIRRALMNLSEETGINLSTLSMRWYRVLRYKQKCFFLMSSEDDRACVNQKNMVIDTTQMRHELKMKMGIMRKVLKLLEQL